MNAHAIPQPATFTDDEFERLIGKGAFDDLGSPILLFWADA